MTSGKDEKKTFFCNKPDHKNLYLVGEHTIEKNGKRYHIKSNCKTCMDEWLKK